RRFPRIQLISVREVFAGKRVDFPGQALGEAPPPRGSLPGENLSLPGIEAPKPEPRKGTIVTLSKAALDLVAPEESTRRPRRSTTKRIIPQKKPENGKK